ncbi:MAG: hypothetical protein ABSB70_21740 [Candidatus Velthaea sp.]|jgi:hypothetical protein
MFERRLAALALTAVLVPPAAFAATPTPAAHSSSHPARIDVTKVQPKALLPKHAEHAEYVVEINKLGQVTRIRSGRPSDSATFNGQTYGNALQSFIRTPDGHVIVGIYRLTYDFDPKTARVRRDVSLLRQGGVDPDAKGAALVLMEKANAGAARPAIPAISPGPAASVDPRSLPDLPSLAVPTPLPTPS